MKPLSPDGAASSLRYFRFEGQGHYSSSCQRHEIRKTSRCFCANCCQHLLGMKSVCLCLVLSAVLSLVLANKRETGEADDIMIKECKFHKHTASSIAPDVWDRIRSLAGKRYTFTTWTALLFLRPKQGNVTISTAIIVAYCYLVIAITS